MFEDSQEKVFSGQETATFDKYLTKVFWWMAVGVFTTFVVAFLLSTTPSLAIAINNSGTIGMIISMVIQFGLIFYLQSKIANLEASKAKGAFIIYSAITGLNFSVFFLVFGITTIFTAFLMAAIFFGSLCLIGHTTKRNLASFGTICIAGLIALVVYQLLAMAFNWSQSGFFVSFIGLVLFIGITARDMQTVKQMYFTASGDNAVMEASAVSGAFELYLDFLNIFIYILRLVALTSSDD